MKRLVGAIIAVLAAGCGDDGGANGDAGQTTAPSTGAAETTLADASGGSTAGAATTMIVDSSDGPADTTAADACGGELPAIVTDIDETLTLSDAEFFMQIQDGSYDPVERDGASELITAYADLGYRIFYLTARAETITIEGTGETAREATDRWLEEHGFPTDPELTEVVLSPTLTVGEDTRMYKADALMDLQGMGWRFDYAYGNAITDIGAYEDAGIAKGVTFIIGAEAGAEGTVAVDGEGWTEHADAHLPAVPQACEPA